MKVFLDTNVLVSAFATRGLCADVLQVILAEHDMITGEVVLTELERVLRSKIGLPGQRIADVLSLLRRYPVEPLPLREVDLRIRDEADRLVLATAIASGAEILVTGDRDLLDVASQVDSIRILDPRGFWSLLRQAG